jgi:hypothetical protein
MAASGQSETPNYVREDGSFFQVQTFTATKGRNKRNVPRGLIAMRAHSGRIHGRT